MGEVVLVTAAVISCQPYCDVQLIAAKEAREEQIKGGYHSNKHSEQCAAYNTLRYLNTRGNHVLARFAKDNDEKWRYRDTITTSFRRKLSDYVCTWTFRKCKWKQFEWWVNVNRNWKWPKRIWKCGKCQWMCLFYPTCPTTCISIDTTGCLICTCKVQTLPPLRLQTTQGPVQPATGPGILTTSSTSLSGSGNSLTGGSTLTGSGNGPNSSGKTGNGNGCASFDASCPAGCASLDASGCLTCTCAGVNTTPPIGQMTQAPIQTGISGGIMSTHAPGLSGSGSGSSLSGGATLTGSGNGPNTSSSTGNGNGCPAYNTSCPAGCASLDAVGCLSCTCLAIPAVSSSALAPSPTPPNTRGTTTQAQYVTEMCPKFDNRCPRNCVILDTRGCLICTCPVTTATPNMMIPTLPVTTPPLTPPTTPSNVQQTPTNLPLSTQDPSVKTSTKILQSTPDIKPSPQTPVSTSSLPVPRSPPPHTCPPIRCVYPCNAGVTPLGADNCPVCKCVATTTYSPLG